MVAQYFQGPFLSVFIPKTKCQAQSVALFTYLLLCILSLCFTMQRYKYFPILQYFLSNILVLQQIYLIYSSICREIFSMRDSFSMPFMVVLIFVLCFFLNKISRQK